MQNLSMIYGCARVSTEAQDLTGQLALLRAAGCEKLFLEKIPRHDRRTAAAYSKRLVAALAPGDVVITPAVDRLSRDTTDLMVIARDMHRAGAGLRSLGEPVLDPTGDFAELVLATPPHCRAHGTGPRAAGEGMNTTGGALVPSQMMPGILAFRDNAVFRQNASVYTMTSDFASVARRTGGVTPVFIGENAPLSESAPTWDSVGLTAKKLAIFDRLSSELVEDSVTDVAAYFLADSGSALGLKEDDCGFTQ